MAIDRKSINLFVEDLRQKAQLNKKLDMDNLINLVTQLGGRVKFDYMPLDMDGKIERTDDKFIITLNENILNNERKKFTLAHELGHLFIHMGFLNPNQWQKENEFIDSTFYRQGYSREEYEANEFAAALLMPADEFIKKAREFSVGNKCNINKLANYFGVSSEAALTRGKWLGVFEWD